jgi:hypothetical protein
LTWAKDCAASLALAILNRPKTAQETRAKAPPIAPSGSASAGREPSAAGRISEAPLAESRPAAETDAAPSRDHVGTAG